MSYSEVVALVVELAQEVEKEDPIDWAYLQLDEEATWNMLATSVVEQYSSMGCNNVLMYATITKLVVENFVLNMRLLQKN